MKKAGDDMIYNLPEMKRKNDRVEEQLGILKKEYMQPHMSRKQLEKLNVVSVDENAYWLIDYWCGKDVKGLIQMPFSRHWIMHIEACLKIRDKQLSIK